MSATDPPVDADAPAAPTTAKETPAIPNAGTALLRRLPFDGRFACDITAFLPLLFFEQMLKECAVSITPYGRVE